MKRLSDTPLMQWSTPDWNTPPESRERVIEVREHLYRFLITAGIPAQFAYVEADERLADMAALHPDLDDTALAGKVVEDML